MSDATLAASCRGIAAVSVTPFSPDGSAVDVDNVEEIAAFLVTEGVDIVVACGNTGEYYALSAAEGRVVAEATVRAVGARVPIVIGVGGAAPAAARAAAHAAEIGAAAVMVHNPANPYVTGPGLLDYLREVASAGVPLIPYLKSPAITTDEVVAIVAEPSVVAVKYAVNDLPAFARAVIGAAGRAEVTWICGTAERWAPFFFAAGAEGFTSGLVNVTAGPSRALLRALQARDETAQRCAWQAILPFEELRARGGDGYNVSVIKEALRQLGRPVGPVRPPSSVVREAEREEIAHALKSFERFNATV
jgi:4-hydroxy-tetrahydrodipicolinate synthase